MARTHSGSPKVPEYTPAPTAARSRSQPQAVVGNYVTLRLIARVAVAATTTVVDRIPLPMGFRVSQVCFYGLGGTGTNTFRIRTVNPTYGPTVGLVHAGTAITQGTPSTVTADQMTAGNREIIRKGYLEFEITNAGGSQPKGSAIAWVTGFFTGHITNQVPYVIGGQTAYAGPIAGYYDILSVINCKAFTTTDDELVQMVVPYDCRVQHINYGIVGLTVGGGPNMAVRMTKAGQTLGFHTIADIDTHIGVLTGGLACCNEDVASGDGTFGQTLTEANRDLVKGDTIEMEGHIAAGDSIPIAAASAHLLVWVKGHVAPIGFD